MRYGINIPGIKGTYETLPDLDCKSHHNHAHYPIPGELVRLEVEEKGIKYEILSGRVIAATNGTRYMFTEPGFQAHKDAGEELLARLRDAVAFVDNKKIAGNVQNTLRRGLGMKEKPSLEQVAA